MAQRDDSATCSALDYDNKSDRKRILVIGETGKGKSSFIRGVGAVDGDGKKPVVGHGPQGETKNCAFFWTDDYTFADTCGLGELQNGSVSTGGAFEKLADLFCTNKDGFHLAMYVVNEIRLSANNARTLEAYVTLLEGKKIPCILICTNKTVKAGMSIEKTFMEDWSKVYRFEDGLYVDFDDIESITDLHDRTSAELKAKKSNEGVKKLLDRYGGKALPLYGENNFKTEFLVWWNSICLKLGLSSFLYVKESVFKMLKACNYTPKDAQMWAARFYNRLHTNIALPPPADNARKKVL